MTPPAPVDVAAVVARVGVERWRPTGLLPPRCALPPRLAAVIEERAARAAVRVHVRVDLATGEVTSLARLLAAEAARRDRERRLLQGVAGVDGGGV